MGVASSAVLAALSPKKQFTDAQDAGRRDNEIQLQNALYQYYIDVGSFPQEAAIPEGKANAKSVCRQGVTGDPTCVNIDILLQRHIAQLPVDVAEPCINYTGYELYREGRRLAVVAAHMGKIKGEAVALLCVADGGGGSSSSSVGSSVSSSASSNGSSSVSSSGASSSSGGDTTPPVISGVQATDIKKTKVTIIWTTDEKANSQVEYGLTVSYGSSTNIDATLVTSHSQNITGLSKQTLYHYRVKSRDGASNIAVSGDNTFATVP